SPSRRFVWLQLPARVHRSPGFCCTAPLTAIRWPCRSRPALPAVVSRMLYRPLEHARDHAFADWQPRLRDGVVVTSRRSVLKASLAGLALLTLPGLLR